MNSLQPIQAFPALDVRKIFSFCKQNDPVLSESITSYYSSGRAALFHALKSLDMPLESEVLLPAYNCGVEVEAALRAGFKVDFFGVNHELSLNIDQINEKIRSRTRVVVVAHYFGFPQDLTELKEICRKKEIVLIEDCAHALYSRTNEGNWVGIEGDMSLFSMRKTVFLPNGGALRLNNKRFASPAKGVGGFDWRLLKTMIRSILEKEYSGNGCTAAVSGTLLTLYSKYLSTVGTTGEATVGDDRWYYDEPLLGYDKNISMLSEIFLGSDDFTGIITSRRKNYSDLQKNLFAEFGEDFIFPELPEGTCPLCFPLNVKERDAVVARMISKGVVPYVFARRPHPLVNFGDFPEVAALSADVIGLPIHQQLAADEMRIVAGIFTNSLER